MIQVSRLNLITILFTGAYIATVLLRFDLIQLATIIYLGWVAGSLLVKDYYRG